jgi:putative flippase GtrA
MIGKIQAASHTRRAAIFIGIGAINTVIDVSAFACFHQLFGLHVIPSNVMAFLIALANSYILNSLITFADRHGGRPAFRSFARFFFVAAIAMTVSTVIVYLLSMLMHPLVAKLIATAASTAINYCGSYWFVFSGGKGGASRAPAVSK